MPVRANALAGGFRFSAPMPRILPNCADRFNYAKRFVGDIRPFESHAFSAEHRSIRSDETSFRNDREGIKIMLYSLGGGFIASVCKVKRNKSSHCLAALNARASSA